MLTRKAKYALNALRRLAFSVGTTRTVAELAEADASPRKFLEAILRELRMHGLVRVRKGPGGGYELARAPETVSIATVLRIIDGPIASESCVSGTTHRRCAECKSEESCGIRLVLRDVHEATLRILETTTLADLAHRSRQANSAQPVLRYAI